MGRSGGWQREQLGEGPQVGTCVVQGGSQRRPSGRGPGVEAVVGEVGTEAGPEPDDGAAAGE